jgi:hypothetical protein
MLDPAQRKEVLVPGNAGSRVDQALILTLARARSWMRALQQGEYTHTAEIAGRFGLAPLPQSWTNFVDLVKCLIRLNRPGYELRP